MPVDEIIERLDEEIAVAGFRRLRDVEYYQEDPAD